LKNYRLENIDPEDIEDLLRKIELSFEIRFADNELKEIATFGELCDHISNRIRLENIGDCTSQQAFYKLRDAITASLPFDAKTISPDFPLKILLPQESRRSKVRKLESHLGFKLNILRPPNWLTNTLYILFLVSFGWLFVDWQSALAGFALSVIGVRLANKMGNELDLQTVGQVAEKMTREYYLKSRRNPKTFNKKEVEKVLRDWFSKELYLEKGELTREANLV